MEKKYLKLHAKALLDFQVDCGIEDCFREDNKRFNDEMKKLDFEFVYEEWTGSHNFYFFDEALKRVLELLYKR